jgi:hypothetical protein
MTVSKKEEKEKGIVGTVGAGLAMLGPGYVNVTSLTGFLDWKRKEPR